MNKKNLLKNLLKILIISSLSKILSLISKIIMTRELGLLSMSIFSLVNPLLLLLLTLSSLSLQTSISVLVAKYPESKKIIFTNSLKITLIISTILMIIIMLTASSIGNFLLKNPLTINSIYGCIFVIPLTSVSSIIKGYFLGKGEIKLTSMSQVFEESGRFLLMISIVCLFPNLSISSKSSIAIYSLAFGEIFQIGYMLVFSSNYSIKKIWNYFKTAPNSNAYVNDILKISIPLTLSRLIGSLTYFVEPILYTYLLTNIISSQEITISYGLLNSYAFPILLMPGFISFTLSNMMIPHLGELIRNKKLFELKKYIFINVMICLTIGIIISIIFVTCSDYITTIIFGSNYGGEIIRKYGLFFIIYYIESPLSTSLSLLGMAKESLYSTIFSSIGRIILILLLVSSKQIDGLCIAIVVSAYLNVILNIIFLFKFFVRNKNWSISFKH